MSQKKRRKIKKEIQESEKKIIQGGQYPSPDFCFTDNHYFLVGNALPRYQSQIS